MFHKRAFTHPLSLCSTTGPMMSCGCHHHHFNHGGVFFNHEDKAELIVKKISKELNLREDQKIMLNKIKVEIVAKHQECHDKRDEMLDSILTQVRGNSLDQEALKDLLECKDDPKQEMKTFMIEKLAEFHSILDQDQRNKLADMMAKFHGKNHR